MCSFGDWGGGQLRGLMWEGGVKLCSDLTMSIRLQRFQDPRAERLRELKALWELPLYPFFEDKNKMGQIKNRSSEKLHKKETTCLI